MNVKWLTCFACLMCLILSSVVFAQEDDVILTQPVTKVIRLYSQDLPPDVNLQAYLSSGEVKLTNGLECVAPKITPGPAPAPYPQAIVWEKGIEQLGGSSVTCDGIWFINGNLWSPHQLALVLWKISIPHPSVRRAEEFTKDLTLSLWVDCNEDKAWGRNERMINDSFNIKKLFPNTWSCLEIYYLSWFFIPRATSFVEVNCGGGVKRYETKLWVRGTLSYDDADVSPAGQALFGEYEDYLINYFEIVYGNKTKS
jgi:hypothetical protein